MKVKEENIMNESRKSYQEHRQIEFLLMFHIFHQGSCWGGGRLCAARGQWEAREVHGDVWALWPQAKEESSDACPSCSQCTNQNQSPEGCLQCHNVGGNHAHKAALQVHSLVFFLLKQTVRFNMAHCEPFWTSLFIPEGFIGAPSWICVIHLSTSLDHYILLRTHE